MDESISLKDLKKKITEFRDVREVKVNPDRIPKLLDEIRELLEGEGPEPNKDCEFCKFAEDRNSSRSNLQTIK